MVPSGYAVTSHDHVANTESFLHSFPDVHPQLSRLLDWRSVAAIGGTFEIAFGAHTLTFGAHETTVSLDEYLVSFLQSMTRDQVDDRDLQDCMLGSFAAKQYGSFSDEFTCLGWTARIGGLLVDFGFQGPGVPTDAIKADLQMALNSVHLESSVA